jgi:hypothetical protein
MDLFVIGSASLKDVISALSQVEKNLGREINPTIISPKEYREKSSKKNHFIRSVTNSKLEFLIGSMDELRRLEN